MQKMLFLIAFIMLMSGCMSNPVKMAKKADDQSVRSVPVQVYNKDVSNAARAGYEEGVKQGATAARKMGGNYVWRPYKVEVVDVPGRVVNGVFYPGHQQEVIVRPTSVGRVYGDEEEGRE